MALAANGGSYAMWAEATEAIKKYGWMVKSPSGYPLQSPYVSIASVGVSDLPRRVGAESWRLHPMNRRCSILWTARRIPRNELPLRKQAFIGRGATAICEIRTCPERDVRATTSLRTRRNKVGVYGVNSRPCARERKTQSCSYEPALTFGDTRCLYVDAAATHGLVCRSSIRPASARGPATAAGG